MSNEAVVELRSVGKGYGGVVAVTDFSLKVRKGEAVALLGPSGCGKTTTLRIIAGFTMPDEGTVLIAGRDMRGVRPYERNVGLVFQDYAVFPHMTVEQNVAYGLRQRRADRRKIPGRVAQMLDLVRLSGFGHRRPNELSGGQQQRVALARALATNPEVILLDEPLSALDAKLRQELRIELKEILNAADSTAIFVTHDQEEAMSLAERIVVMHKGRIVQEGSPSAIYSKPRTRFVAEFIGRSNWFEGRPGALIAPGVREFTSSDGLSLQIADSELGAADNWHVCVRPERVMLLDAGETPPEKLRAGNRLPATLVDVSFLGAELHYSLALPSGRILLAIEKNHDRPIPEPGEQRVIGFNAGDCIAVREDS